MKSALRILIILILSLPLFSQSSGLAWMRADKDTAWNSTFSSKIDELLSGGKIPANVVGMVFEAAGDSEIGGSPEEFAEFMYATIKEMDKRLRRGTAPSVVRLDIRQKVQDYQPREGKPELPRGAGEPGRAVGIRAGIDGPAKNSVLDKPVQRGIMDLQKPAGGPDKRTKPAGPPETPSGPPEAPSGTSPGTNPAAGGTGDDSAPGSGTADGSGSAGGTGSGSTGTGSAAGTSVGMNPGSVAGSGSTVDGNESGAAAAP